jgi:hypothetical protein
MQPSQRVHEEQRAGDAGVLGDGRGDSTKP